LEFLAAWPFVPAGHNRVAHPDRPLPLFGCQVKKSKKKKTSPRFRLLPCLRTTYFFIASNRPRQGPPHVRDRSSPPIGWQVKKKVRDNETDQDSTLRADFIPYLVRDMDAWSRAKAPRDTVCPHGSCFFPQAEPSPSPGSL
jgi:hypothetical protein